MLHGPVCDRLLVNKQVRLRVLRMCCVCVMGSKHRWQTPPDREFSLPSFWRGESHLPTSLQDYNHHIDQHHRYRKTCSWEWGRDPSFSWGIPDHWKGWHRCLAMGKHVWGFHIQSAVCPVNRPARQWLLLYRWKSRCVPKQAQWPQLCFVLSHIQILMPGALRMWPAVSSKCWLLFALIWLGL